MNRFIGIGNWAKEQDVRYTQDGKAIAKCSMAFARQGEGADFINTVAFGKTAEFLEKYAQKGQKMAIEGRIQSGSYEKDGKKVYTTDIVIEKCEFVEKKAEAAESNANAVQKAVDNGFINIPDGIQEELPFV